MSEESNYHKQDFDENGKEPASANDILYKSSPVLSSLAFLTDRLGGITYTRKGIAKLCIIGAATLITIKVVVALYTGSLGIRADAIHSLVDLLGAIAVYIGIKVADKPHDNKHNFGYAKAENIAALFVFAVIVFGAGWIVYGALTRSQSDSVTMLPVGICVTLAAIILNVIIAWLAIHVAKNTDSIALEAQGYHMLTDVLSSVAVLAGLILVAVTGYVVLDTIIALVVMVLILRTGWKIGAKALDGLMDSKMPPEEESAVRETIKRYRQQIAGLKRLRTRKTGRQREIDIEIIVPGWENMSTAHHTCDKLENELKKQFPESILSIHVEPCPNPDMKDCPTNCSVSGTCEVKKLLDSW
jgi:cation diffusion facilitator family transporter